MVAGPSRKALATSEEEGKVEPLPPKLAPARGVVLAVLLGAAAWVGLILAYAYTR